MTTLPLLIASRLRRHDELPHVHGQQIGECRASPDHEPPGALSARSFGIR